MPMYDVQCPRCGDEWEQLARIEQIVECDGCRVPVQRLISAPHTVADNLDAKSYYDDGLGVHITSRSQRRRLMRERSLEELGPSQNKHGTTGRAYSFPGQTVSSVPLSGAYLRKR
mgnify:CR=1 FL=1